MDEESTIIIDHGWTCKAGFAEDLTPRIVIPSIIGFPRKSCSVGFVFKDGEFYAGHEAQIKREFLDVTFPIKQGIITNWDCMEKVIFTLNFILIIDSTIINYTENIISVILQIKCVTPSPRRPYTFQY